jgi:hypothetical protein
MEIRHLRQSPEQGVHAFPQGTGAFSMDHPHPADAEALALREILRQQFADFRGPEGMQVQFVGHRDLDRIRVEFVIVHERPDRRLHRAKWLEAKGRPVRAIFTFAS